MAVAGSAGEHTELRTVNQPAKVWKKELAPERFQKDVELGVAEVPATEEPWAVVGSIRATAAAELFAAADAPCAFVAGAFA